jgi:hypothetical protein
MIKHVAFTTALMACLGFTTAAHADSSAYANTYEVATTGITVPALPTDMACLEVTAGAVTVVDIKVNGHAAVGVTTSVQVLKRSAHNTGGAPTAFTPTPRRTGMPASTAVLQGYTAVPTPLGALVGLVDEEDALIVAAASTTGGNPAHFDFKEGSALTISGTEAICVSAPATSSSFAGASLEVTFRLQQ